MELRVSEWAGTLGAHAGSFVGSWTGDWIARRWGGRLKSLFNDGVGLGGTFARAVVDGYVVDRLIGATWPSLGVLAFVLALHAFSTMFGSVELERIATGLAVLCALAWSGWAVVQGGRGLAPHLRLWLVTRLPLQAHVRLQLFQLIRTRHRQMRHQVDEVGEPLRSLFDTLQQRLCLTPDHAAFQLASHLAPIVIRHVANRLAMIVLPVLGALLYYRFAIYPDLIQSGTGIGPWAITMYPFAALADGVFGTSLRGMVSGPH